jgi:periplasmic divalent cation tolerance protein
MTDLRQVSTAAPDRETAEALASSAVHERLAASAQILGPVTSVFWHLGQSGTGEEWIVLLKTTADRYPALEQHLVGQHPWDNPEVTAVPIVAAPTPYLEWARTTVSDPG